MTTMMNYTEISSTALHRNLKYFAFPPLETQEGFRVQRYLLKWKN